MLQMQEVDILPLLAKMCLSQFSLTRSIIKNCNTVRIRIKWSKLNRNGKQYKSYLN